MTAPFQQTRTAFQDYRAALSPTALLNPIGAAFEEAFGHVEDALLDRVAASVRARFAGLAPADALAAIGADRLIERGPAESDSAYVARLVNAWSTWPWAGTPYGMLQAFKGLGYDPTGIILVQAVGGLAYSLDANGALAISTAPSGVWMMDPLGNLSPPRPSFWSKFDVLFVSPLPSSWGGGGTLPGSSSDEVNRIRRIISAWKPGHATCNRIAVLTNARWWGYPFTQNWGTGIWGGAGTYWTP